MLCLLSTAIWVVTWKISSLWDSKEWSFSLRFLRSHNATVWEKQSKLCIQYLLQLLHKAAFLLSVWNWIGTITNETVYKVEIDNLTFLL